MPVSAKGNREGEEGRGEERKPKGRKGSGRDWTGSDRARGRLSHIGILLMHMHVCDGEMLMREE